MYEKKTKRILCKDYKELLRKMDELDMADDMSMSITKSKNSNPRDQKKEYIITYWSIVNTDDVYEDLNKLDKNELVDLIYNFHSSLLNQAKNDKESEGIYYFSEETYNIKTTIINFLETKIKQIAKKKI